MGMVSALHGSPESFNTSSSPVDLTRLALWTLSCNAALSVPGGVADAQGLVVPTEVGGAKSCTKYLDRVYGSLRAVSSEPMHQGAIATLQRLFKLWMKETREPALALVRKHRISWGAVLKSGSPQETKKVKGTVIRQIKSPPKPSRSPFLSNVERQALSSLLASEWDRPTELREQWLALAASEQHDQFPRYVRELKEYYERISKLSSGMHAKLGHRKKWIHAACEEAGVAPKRKKDRSNEFVWASAFFKLDLQKINLSVALVFSPAHYLENKYDCITIQDNLWDEDRMITSVDCTREVCGDTVDLWKEWATRFLPNFSVDSDVVPRAETLQDDNPFAHLPDSQES
jgi:hypothetical protein